MKDPNNKNIYKEVVEPLPARHLPVQPLPVQPLPVQYLPVQQPPIQYPVQQPPVQYPVQQPPVQYQRVEPVPVQPLPVQALPVQAYDNPTPQNISKKKGRFKRWFFKGRIEKKEAKEERIETLSREYDEGKIILIGKGRK